ELHPTQAVIYDRKWFFDVVRYCGLTVQQTVFPPAPGHQWTVFLKRRTPDAIDHFPIGEEGAEWLSGATRRPMAKLAISEAETEKFKVENFPEKDKTRLYSTGRLPQPQLLNGPLAELIETKTKLAETKAALATANSTMHIMQRSWSWKIGRTLTLPVRLLRSK